MPSSVQRPPLAFPLPIPLATDNSTADDSDLLLSPKSQEWRTLNFVSLQFGIEQRTPLTPPLSDDESDAISSGTSSSEDQDPDSAACSPSDDEPAQERLHSALDDVADRHREQPERLTFERKLGDTELSYFLPSRADGVNDMYLHLGFRAPAHFLAPRRIRAAWAYFRLQHALLAAKVRMEPFDYDSARFVYTPPRSVEEALAEAEAALSFRDAGKDELIDGYLNGERTLSNDRLSYLIVGSTRTDTDLPTPAQTPVVERTENESFEGDVREFDILICSTHFLGDGMALHTFANEFFTLIAGSSAEMPLKTTEEIEGLLEAEFAKRWNITEEEVSASRLPVLSLSLEQALPPVQGRFRKAAAKVDHQNSQRKLIGGHAFKRAKNPKRRTVVPTIPFSPEQTKMILKKCKANGVSIANAIFALCTLAWARIHPADPQLPIMMYTALNIRQSLRADADVRGASYYFTAIGYLNVVLPAFLPSPSTDAKEQEEQTEKTFWHRAREAKRQITQVAKHPLLVGRTHAMAEERGARAKVWAREDDEKEAGIWVPPSPPTIPTSTPALTNTDAAPAKENKPWILPRAPSTALMGLSMLGNLDGMYHHASYPLLDLHTLTTGSRQRAGAALLFGYTFRGKLWLSLGYDELGFAEGEDGIGRWWQEVVGGVDGLFGCGPPPPPPMEGAGKREAL